MSDSDDDFGEVDDEAMLLAVASAEQQPQVECADFRAPKRPRIGEREPLRTIGGFARPARQSDGPGISESQPFEISSHQDYAGSWDGRENGLQRLRAPQSNLKQTTLFGAQTSSQTPPSQQTRRHNWPLANKSEEPTHHRLQTDELSTWIYPTNIGSIRDYQFNIVARGLYHNLLVALPTGLGKTFIAATIMLNWYRWTADSQIVFVAPTRPLVSQQVDACFNIAGIPRSDTSMLTGNIPPGIRAEEWSEKRVFFMTPQTIINDLKSGICDPKRIVLLVVDEAHRATGSYAYVEVVKFMRRFNTSFRVLALTATPGSTVEGVQEVIDGLGISRVEIRTEDSLDIREYVHQRNIETTIFEYSEELVMCMDLFSKALQPLVNKVKGMNAYWSHNPMTLTAFGCTQARQKWMNSDAGRSANWGIKGMINAVFSILASLAHAVELLKFHGIGPFYRKVVTFRAETEGMGEKGSKHKREVVESASFKKMMTRISSWMGDKDFVGHPKLEFLRSIALNHFLDAGDGRHQGSDQISPARTRIMVFAHFRDSAEEIVRVLKRNEPMIRPHVFVGQATSNASEGMGQKQQLDIIDKFRRGVYNTLVATSIGEEGLDIGEVDLIVCYDGSASPIRMLQRMGRTGRKRAGRIEVLLMKEKEHDNFEKAKDNYEKMQEMIASGKRFTFHEHLSPRILPRDIQPVVEKRPVEIPIENSQADLPEPKRRKTVPKRPPKKFHLPDNARLGFTTASRLVKPNGEDFSAPKPHTSLTPEPVPHNSTVFLTDAETQELERVYQSVSGEEGQTVEPPRMDAYPAAQRELRPTGWITHGRTSTSLSNMLAAMHQFASPFASLEQFERNLDQEDQQLIDRPDANSSDLEPPQPTKKKNGKKEKKASLVLLDAAESSISSSAAELLISDEPDDPRYASDLADFIDDGEPTINEESTVSLASSPPSHIIDQTPARDNVPLSQASVATNVPDLDTLLGVANGQSEKAQDNTRSDAVRRRARAVIESDSDE